LTPIDDQSYMLAGSLATLSMLLSLFVGARLRGRRGLVRNYLAVPQRPTAAARGFATEHLHCFAAKKTDPLIAATFPLLAARQAIEPLAAGTAAGKIVLTNP
jgi:NADPH:quinone reductase